MWGLWVVFLQPVGGYLVCSLRTVCRQTNIEGHLILSHTGWRNIPVVPSAVLAGTGHLDPTEEEGVEEERASAWLFLQPGQFLEPTPLYLSAPSFLGMHYTIHIYLRLRQLLLLNAPKTRPKRPEPKRVGYFYAKCSVVHKIMQQWLPTNR